MPVPPGQVVVQLRVTLEDIRPVIWRRLLVPGGVRLPRFHRMLQVAMGWTDSHLHQFGIGERLWGMQFEDHPGDEMDEETVTVTGAISGVRRFFYDYDFGDGWSHEVVVEDVARLDRGLKHAVCLDGQRACPPDVRGQSSVLAFGHQKSPPLAVMFNPM